MDGILLLMRLVFLSSFLVLKDSFILSLLLLRGWRGDEMAMNNSEFGSLGVVNGVQRKEERES